MWINKAAICNPRMSVRFFSCVTGSYLVPTKLSGRITLFFLSLTSLFLYTSYSANIVALQQSPSSALSSLSDLVHSPLAVGIQDLEYNRVYFKVHLLEPLSLLSEMVELKLVWWEVEQVETREYGD